MQTVIVILIVLVALGFSLKKIIKTINSKQPQCNCGCGGCNCKNGCKEEIISGK